MRKVVVRRIPEIDGLRALAVLGVICFHFKAALLPGGFLGVDLFFVVSGYVICGLLQRQDARALGPFLLTFYGRRMLRILPALLVCLLVTHLFYVLFVPFSWSFKHINRSGLSAFWGLSNFFLLGEGPDYFAPEIAFNPFIHTWSLGVEEQFYLIFPLLLALSISLRRKDCGARLLSWMSIAGPALLSFLGAAMLSRTQHSFAFYMLPTRFWELALGALLALHRSWILRLIMPRVVDGIIPLLGLAAVVLSMTLTKSDQQAIYGIAASCFGTALIVVGLMRDSRSFIYRLLAVRPLQALGRASYSLYLWHLPVAALFRWTVGLDTPCGIVAALSLAALLAAVSYKGIEQPILSSSTLAALPKPLIILVGLLAMAASWSLAGAFHRNQKALCLSQTTDVGRWGPWSPSGQAEQKACEPIIRTNARFPLATEYVNPDCPRPFSGRRLFIIGDSHVDTLKALAYQCSKDHGVHISMLGVPACPQISFLPVPPKLMNLCRKAEQDYLTLLEEQSKPGDIVLMASLRLQPPKRTADGRMQSLHELMQKHRHNNLPERKQAVLDRGFAFLRPLASQGLQIILLAPGPLFSAAPFRCSDWFNRSNPLCPDQGFALDKELFLQYRQPMMQILSDFAQAEPSIHIFDPLPPLCPGQYCRAFDADEPLMLDTNHFSPHAIALLQPSLHVLLKRLWSSSTATP